MSSSQPRQLWNTNLQTPTGGNLGAFANKRAHRVHSSRKAEYVSSTDRAGKQVFRLLPKHAMSDIRPEFLQHIEYAVEADLRCPFLAGFRPCALRTRIVEIGNTRCCAVANNLGEVESFATRVGASHEESADRIACTFDEASMGASVVAGILARCIRHNEFSEVVAYGLIGK